MAATLLAVLPPTTGMSDGVPMPSSIPFDYYSGRDYDISGAGSCGKENGSRLGIGKKDGEVFTDSRGRKYVYKNGTMRKA